MTKLLGNIKGLISEKKISLLLKYSKKFCNKKNWFVEIGTFQGLSSISFAINNRDVKCITIDNFFFGKKNLKIFKQNKKKSKVKNLRLIPKDYEKAYSELANKKVKIGLLFVDGPHDYRSQYFILEKYKKLLSSRCCIIIDDANYEHVRLATRDFLENNKEFKLVEQKYTKNHPEITQNEGYENGYNVITRGTGEKKIKLEIDLKKALKFQYDSHYIQRHYFGNNVLKILDILYLYFKDHKKKYLSLLLKLYNKGVFTRHKINLK